MHSDQDERVYVTLYGLTLLAVRVLLYALDEYARRKHRFDERGAVRDLVRSNLAAVLVAYAIILAIGMLRPLLAVVLYFVVTVVLIVPFRGVERLVVGPKR